MKHPKAITTALLTAFCYCLQPTDLPGQTKFQVGINGSGWGAASQQTFDGGYIIAAYYDSDPGFPVNNDIILIKIDTNSGLLWSKSFDLGSDDRAFSVQQTDDDANGQKNDGYIIGGWTWASGDAVNFCLVKTDANGDMIWSKIFKGNINMDERGGTIIQTNDGGYIIAGYAASFGAGSTDIYLVKTDASGNLSWSRTFGGAGSEYVSDEAEPSIQQTSDGGYIIVGTTTSFGAGGNDVYLVKTDGSGNLTWSRTFGGANNDNGYSVRQTTDGGYILTGYTASFGAGSNDIYLVKTNGSGNLSWSRTFGGAGGDNGNSVQQTTDGGYVITGGTASFGSSFNDVYLVKTDGNGDLLWSRKYAPGGSNEYGACVTQTGDGGFFISGLGGAGIYLIKTD